MKGLDMYDLNYNNPYHFNRHNHGDIYKLKIQHSYNNPSLYYGGATSRQYGTNIHRRNFLSSSVVNNYEERKNNYSNNILTIKNNLLPNITEHSTYDNGNSNSLRINKALLNSKKQIIFPKFSPGPKSNATSIKLQDDTNSLIDQRFNNLKYNLAPHHPKEEQKEGQSEYRAEYVPYSPDLKHPIYKKEVGLIPIVDNIFRRDRNRDGLSTAQSNDRTLPSRKDVKRSLFKVEEKPKIEKKTIISPPQKKQDDKFKSAPPKKIEPIKKIVEPPKNSTNKRNESPPPKKVEIIPKLDSPQKKVEQPKKVEEPKKIISTPKKVEPPKKVEEIKKPISPPKKEIPKKEDQKPVIIPKKEEPKPVIVKKKVEIPKPVEIGIKVPEKPREEINKLRKVNPPNKQPEISIEYMDKEEKPEKIPKVDIKKTEIKKPEPKKPEIKKKEEPPKEISVSYKDKEEGKKPEPKKPEIKKEEPKKPEIKKKEEPPKEISISYKDKEEGKKPEIKKEEPKKPEIKKKEEPPKEIIIL